MKIAIYTRVSTEKQDYENQLYDLKEYANKKGWTIYKVYEEIISGKESNRPEFKAMMDDAALRKFDAILVWALDRFTREGVAQVWNYIKRLEQYGVQFHSYKEQYLSTDNKMVKDMLFSIMGILAEQERLRISDRTKAGLQQARIKGIKLGKPEVPDDVKLSIIKMREQGKSFRDICKEVYYWDKSRNKHFVSMGFVHKTLSKAHTNNLRNNEFHSSGV